ncbi:peptide deformylase, partial [Flavobacterium sp.]
MIIPIYGYGEPVLRKVAMAVTPDYPNLKDIIANMYDTMYNAYGVGLAAPQVGIAIRLFTIDTSPFSDDKDLSNEQQNQLKNFKKTFINAKILK